jgi:hypothetical protein
VSLPNTESDNNDDVGLTDIFYQRDREFIALPPPDPVAVGMGWKSVVQGVCIPVMSVV